MRDLKLAFIQYVLYVLYPSRYILYHIYIYCIYSTLPYIYTHIYQVRPCASTVRVQYTQYTHFHWCRLQYHDPDCSLAQYEVHTFLQAFTMLTLWAVWWCDVTANAYHICKYYQKKTNIYFTLPLCSHALLRTVDPRAWHTKVCRAM
jgi:hypothetical protein